MNALKVLLVRFATMTLLSLFALQLAEGPGMAAAPSPDADGAAREKMVREQIEARGIHSVRVLAAMRKVPRHEFVPASLRSMAYADHPLPIGKGQTISQPYIVALMTELAAIGPESRVLEIGTGSGYQAAILGEIAQEVFSIEIVPELAKESGDILRRLGYLAVHVREGDGYLGWPEKAPFDAILVTAAPARIPPPLLQQLKVGGRLVIPVGDQSQELVVCRCTEKGVEREEIIPVRFVPMTGKAEGR